MADFWKRFSRNRQAVLGLIILCVVIFVAAIANIIYPETRFYTQNFHCLHQVKMAFYGGVTQLVVM